jgi:translation initiation factor IF-2
MLIMMAHKKPTIEKEVSRPPVVAIMGHIDHGKSTLLDFIRKTNVVAKEAGGITQHVSAYEITHPDPETKELKCITFIDTPGHEAFGGMRGRGAQIADLAILVVSAEDGVKAQTLEVLSVLKKSATPFIVAITKIDKPNASIDRARQSLAENEVLVEGYGGNISVVPVSGKTGEGISELLDTILLTALLEELKGDPEKNATGFVLEASVSARHGVLATVVIKDGTLRTGMFIVIGSEVTKVRQLEGTSKEKMTEASFSTPLRLEGLSALPVAGDSFSSFVAKEEADKEASLGKELLQKKKTERKKILEGVRTVPIVIRADVLGTLEAILGEMGKIEEAGIQTDIIDATVGHITEGDVKLAAAKPDTLILGFNVKVEGPAQDLAFRQGITLRTFDLIYELVEFVKKTLEERKPKDTVIVATGKARIIRLFGKTKQKQVVGCSVLEGVVKVKQQFKILRNNFEIGRGEVSEVQVARLKVKEVPAGEQCGLMLETKTTLAMSDILELFDLVEN